MLSGIDNQSLICLFCQIYYLLSLVLHFQRDFFGLDEVYHCVSINHTNTGLSIAFQLFIQHIPFFSSTMCSNQLKAELLSCEISINLSINHFYNNSQCQLINDNQTTAIDESVLFAHPNNSMNEDTNLTHR
jgi:hypothetical protein